MVLSFLNWWGIGIECKNKSYIKGQTFKPWGIVWFKNKLGFVKLFGIRLRIYWLPPINFYQTF